MKKTSHHCWSSDEHSKNTLNLNLTMTQQSLKFRSEILLLKINYKETWNALNK